MAIITPANMNPGAYESVVSYSDPTIGGPTNDAIPWKSNNSPNAFVNFSSPNKSTRITDVNPTYAPMVKPKTAA